MEAKKKWYRTWRVFPVVLLGVMALIGQFVDPPPAPPTSVEAAQPPGKQLSFYEVSGYVVPGMPSLAKQMGYTKCEHSYYALTCQHPSPPDFFGVPVQSATVSMDRGNHVGLQEQTPAQTDNIQGASLDELSYKSILLEFKPQTYDQACIDRLKTTSYSMECADPGTVDAVVRAMERDGWVLVSDWKGNRTWLHHEVNASIADMRWSPDNALTLSKEDPADVRDRLAEHARRNAKRAKEEANAKRLVDEMKG